MEPQFQHVIPDSQKSAETERKFDQLVDETRTSVLATTPAARVPEEAMREVAEEHAHGLALELECVLHDYSGKWYDSAMNRLSAYRDAMNAIHERESPTYMGEPVLPTTEHSSAVAAPNQDRESAPKDYSDCHGPDWTDRDGEYLK